MGITPKTILDKYLRLYLYYSNVYFGIFINHVALH